MSEHTPINNGGEAPDAAKASGIAQTAAADSTDDLMHQHGGEAPSPSEASASERTTSGDDQKRDGSPPVGGFVRKL
jgi:hypothetical protein